MYRVLASGKTLSLLDPAHRQDAVVLLVRHRAGVLQYRVRSGRTLRPTELVDAVSL